MRFSSSKYFSIKVFLSFKIIFLLNLIMHSLTFIFALLSISISKGITSEYL